jgi:replicative DNA helicase
MGAERAILLIVARDRDRRHERMESLLRHLGPEDFTDPAWRAIFQAFLEEVELDRPPEGMEPEAARRMEGLLEDHAELIHAERSFGDALAQVRLTSHQRRVHELNQRMGEAESEDEKQALAEEKAKVAREGREIGVGWSHAARRLGS